MNGKSPTIGYGRDGNLHGKGEESIFLWFLTSTMIAVNVVLTIAALILGIRYQWQ